MTSSCLGRAPGSAATAVAAAASAAAAATGPASGALPLPLLPPPTEVRGMAAVPVDALPVAASRETWSCWAEGDTNGAEAGGRPCPGCIWWAARAPDGVTTGGLGPTGAWGASAPSPAPEACPPRARKTWARILSKSMPISLCISKTAGKSKSSNLTPNPSGRSAQRNSLSAVVEESKSVALSFISVEEVAGIMVKRPRRCTRVPTEPSDGRGEVDGPVEGGGGLLGPMGSAPVSSDGIAAAVSLPPLAPPR
mmetsp:Transcript_81871/g.226923  ORF Transcript_81871/g.226923 Transcript_81871/m.226923 type:complete len:252 (-) Transcript_81871:777-1532(-)